MKFLLIFVFAITLVSPVFSQNNQLAKSDEAYTKLFHDSKVKLARSHAEFYAEAKKNNALWKYFKDRTFAAGFLAEMKFCKDGLITLDLRVGDQAFEAAVGKVLGFESSFWKKWEKGFCCEDGSCSPCSVHSKCNTRNCGKSVLTGGHYDPQEVLGPGR